MPNVSNSVIYIACLGADVILQQVFDPADGRIHLGHLPPVLAKKGAGPRHQALHPKGQFLYVLNELDSTIVTYAVDQKPNGVQARQAIELLSGRAVGAQSAADIHITPDGGFLYASARGSDTLTSFAIDPHSGWLKRIESIPTEASPRGFSIDPLGKYLVVAGQVSDSVSVYRIDPQSGRLFATGRLPTTPNSNWIEMVCLLPTGEL